MVDLKNKKLNEKLQNLKKQKIPTLNEIKKENIHLEKEEKSFLKRFFIKKVKKK